MKSIRQAITRGKAAFLSSSINFSRDEIKSSRRIARFFRWMMVGAINTAWGLSIITLLHLMFGVSIVASNLAAYASGAVLSYFFNRRYTFHVSKAGIHEFIRFFLCQGVSLGVMILVVLTLTALGLPFLATQVLTLIVYSVTFFLLSEFIVFRDMQGWRESNMVSRI